jgi:hypothetical protein
MPPVSPVSAPAHRAVAVLLVPAAVVVALLLVWLRVRFQPPTLPPYVGGDEGDGGQVAPTPVTLVPGGRFEMDVRPTAPVQGAVAARGFLLRGDDVRPWDPPFAVSADGVVRIAGPVDELFSGVPQGSWQVAIAVGRPEFLPTAPHDVLRARDQGSETATWHLVLKPVRLESLPSSRTTGHP